MQREGGQGERRRERETKKDGRDIYGGRPHARESMHTIAGDPVASKHSSKSFLLLSRSACMSTGVCERCAVAAAPAPAEDDPAEAEDGPAMAAMLADRNAGEFRSQDSDAKTSRRGRWGFRVITDAKTSCRWERGGFDTSYRRSACYVATFYRRRQDGMEVTKSLLFHVHTNRQLGLGRWFDHGGRLQHAHACVVVLCPYFLFEG